MKIPTTRTSYVANPEELIAKARVGDLVTIVTPHGNQRAGRVVFARPDGSPHLTLNLGGPHGTPGVATASNILRVKQKR